MILIKLIRNLVLVMQLSMFMTTTVLMAVKPPTFSAASDVTTAATDASNTKVHDGALRKVRFTNETTHSDDDDDELSSSNSIPPPDRCIPCSKRSGLQIYYTGTTIGGNCLERCVYRSTLWAWLIIGWACGDCTPHI